MVFGRVQEYLHRNSQEHHLGSTSGPLAHQLAAAAMFSQQQDGRIGPITAADSRLQ